MKTVIFYIALSLFSYEICEAQTQTTENAEKIENLQKQKEEIVAEEKAELKEKVERINSQLENREINREQAENLKKEAAKKHALNIENRVAILENKIALLSRGEEEEDESDSFWRFEKDSRPHNNENYYTRTTSALVVAAGFNNALSEGQSLQDSDFKIGGSRFFEIGIAFNTRVFNKSNWLRLRYGASFQLNGLKPKDNHYFVEDGDLTYLEEFEYDLDKSKFRMDNLVFPVHFEFGPSRRYESYRGVKFDTNEMFKIGLGGYAGFNIGERQKLKYEADGDRVKEKLKNDYNTNDFVYGLSGYMGWGGTSLYVKYDLNPIFQDPNVELNNFSVGLRFDLE
ncbi:hypothetical protein RM545_05780 [Zunongwangia sp. F260]|uniref:Outer membrane protein beta-barrel domain-containing protein n=1 Tax=Autumnicola lenta TaxID=3075593 RepID=A0ABU3CIJ8_9FLAO|nr:hypothetical protein [Zunongwangia sp. F260]MDT0646191.1 hypothetical protein [Zunongwangia sp. F260]